MVIFLAGCSDTSPVAPVIEDEEAPVSITAQQNPQENPSEESAYGNSGRNLWVYELIYVDTETMAYQKIPSRDVTTHLNVLTWLENGPCTNCFKIIGINPSGSGTLLIDIEISHPFDNLSLSGFDVRGIPMFNGSRNYPEHDLNTPDRTLGDGELVNADGYTTLYNWSTAGSGPNGLQGYMKGKFASTALPDAQLNGFIRHNSDSPSNTRNVFMAGDAVTRTYEIDMPDGAFIFGYAVDANWAPPDVPTVTDPITDFPLDANCPEPWKIEVMEVPIDQGLTEQGGSTELIIDIYDWQGHETHYEPIIECPELFSGTTYGSPQEDLGDHYRYSAIVENSLIAGVGEYGCLISSLDLENDSAPDWLDLTAYQVITLEVHEFNNVPPVAVATGDPLQQNPDVDIHFYDDGSYDPDGGDIVKYEWDWNNDGTFDEEGEDAYHSWTDEGNYHVQFRVTDNEGSTDILYDPIEVEIVIGDLIPIAFASADPNPQVVCGDITFDDDGSYDPDGGLIAEYQWDWNNDGTWDDSGVPITHAFDYPGLYLVNFRVQDDEGTWGELTEPLEINIENALPTAVAEADNYEPDAGDTVNFSGSGSYDNDCGGQFITNWEWDFENDGTYDDSGENVSHIYYEGGTKSVQLRVTDNEGGIDILDDPLSILVYADPVAVANTDINPALVCDIVTFNGGDSYDPDGGSIALYEWDFNNDGSYEYSGVTCPMSFSLVGTFYMNLRVTDDEGATDTLDTPLAIEIGELPPTAVITQEDFTVYPYKSIGFNGLLSQDNDCYGDMIVEYHWDWDNNGTYDATGASKLHYWTSPGTYYVQLKVIDDEGSEDTLDSPYEVIVDDPPKPTALAAAEPNPQTVCEDVHLHDDGSTGGGTLIVWTEWDIGNDGTWEYGDETHVYYAWDEPGTYYVQYKVTNNYGGWDVLDEPLEIVIENALPTSSAWVEKNTLYIDEVATFFGNLSHDNDCDSNEIVKWEWDFDGDGSYEVTETDPNTTHSFDTAGEYDVQLRVTDDEGTTDVLDTPIHISVFEGWARTWGGEDSERVLSIDTDFSGNVYACGKFYGTVDFDPSASVESRTSNGGCDAFLVKYDSKGNFQWVKTWGGTSFDEASSVVSYDTFNVFVCGYYEGTNVNFNPDGWAPYTSNGDLDAFLIRYNASGEYQFAGSWGGYGTDHASCITRDDTPYIYISGGFEDTVDFNPWTGTTNRTSAGSRDAYIMRVTNSGSFSWVNTWGGPSTDVCQAITHANAKIYGTGVYYDTADFDPGPGTTNWTSKGGQDAFIVGYSTSGTFNWVRVWGGTGTDGGHDIFAQPAGDERVYIIGDYTGTCDFDPTGLTDSRTSNGETDNYIVEYSSTGSYNGAWAWGGTGNDFARAISGDVMGTRIYAVGEFRSVCDFDPDTGAEWGTSNGQNDVYLSAFDGSMNHLWLSTWGDDAGDSGYAVHVDFWNGIYAGGYYNGDVDFNTGPGVDMHHAEGFDDAFLVNYPEDGTW